MEPLRWTKVSAGCWQSEPFIVDDGSTYVAVNHPWALPRGWTLIRDGNDAAFCSSLHEAKRQAQMLEEEDEDRCSCGNSLDDGEGWDGLCGTCADRQEHEDGTV